MLGLLLYASGAFLFYPAAQAHTYNLFLLALFVIASGLAFLETTANPLVTVLGSGRRRGAAFESGAGVQSFGLDHRHSDRTALHLLGRRAYGHRSGGDESCGAQAFYAAESSAVQTPYLVIGGIVVLWALLVALTRFPATSSAAEPAGQRHGIFGRLLRKRRFVLAIVAQFFYVGAQVGIWSFLIRYIQDGLPGTPEKSAAVYLTASLVLFMVGRFVGTALLRYLPPARLLAIFALINLALCSIAVATPHSIGVYRAGGQQYFHVGHVPDHLRAGPGRIGR